MGDRGPGPGSIGVCFPVFRLARKGRERRIHEMHGACRNGQAFNTERNGLVNLQYAVGRGGASDRGERCWAC